MEVHRLESSNDHPRAHRHERAAERHHRAEEPKDRFELTKEGALHRVRALREDIDRLRRDYEAGKISEREFRGHREQAELRIAHLRDYFDL